MKQKTAIIIVLFLFSEQCLGKPHVRSLSELADEFIQISRIMDCISYLDQKRNESDPDMQLIMDYIQGQQYRNVLDHLWKEESGFINLYRDYRAQGLALDLYFSKNYKTAFNEWAGLDPFQPPARSQTPNLSLEDLRSVGDIINGCLSQMAESEVTAWFIEQSATNDDMINFLTRLQEVSTQNIISFMKQSPDFLSMRCQLIATGISIQQFEEAVCLFLGWTVCDYPAC